MNKFIKIILSLMISLVALTSFCFAGEKVTVTYYYGDGCHFCEKIKPFMQDMEQKYSEDVVFEKLEIFNNKENYKQFSAKMNIYGIPENDRGTPTVIVNNKVLIGSDEIVGMEPEIIQAIKNRDNPVPPEVADSVVGALGCPNELDKGFTLGTLRTIVSLALVDSINPCAMMVLIILLSSLMVYQKSSKKKLALTVLAFISAVYITYFVIGFGIVNVIVSAGISKIVIQAVGGIALLIGLLNIKDAVWHKEGDWAIEIPDKWKGVLTKVILGVTSPIGAFTAGCTVTMFELPCTGGPYMFGLSLISSSADYYAQVLLLAVYNLIFIMPLVLTALLAIKGTVTIENAEELRSKHLKAIHLVIGVVMIVAGVWVLFFR